MFHRLFHAYYEKLHRYAFTILKDNHIAEDIVQAVFLKLWEKKDQLLMENQIGSYLYRTTYNLSLNYIRDNKTRKRHIKNVSKTIHSSVDNVNEKLSGSELSIHIHEVIETLPPRCKLIFLKSRKEGKKYKEIAAEMNISVKTVEAQMGKALKIFREALKDYL